MEVSITFTEFYLHIHLGDEFVLRQVFIYLLFGNFMGSIVSPPSEVVVFNVVFTTYDANRKENA